MANFDEFSFEGWSEENHRPKRSEAEQGGFEWDGTPEEPVEGPVEEQQWLPDDEPDERVYAPRRRRAWDTWKKVLIPVAAVLLVGVIVLGVGFVYASQVSKLTTIYPNVSVNGVDVGGMTVDEAASALREDPDRYANAAVTVNFPTGESLTVTADQLGLQPADGTDLAQIAYDYGRKGSLLANWRTYQSCKDKAVDMTADRVAPAIDEQTITGLVQPVADTVDQQLRTADVQIGQDEITVVKNSGTTQVDVAAVTDMIREAFETEDYAAIDYTLPAPGTVEGSQDQATDVDALLQEAYDEVYVAPVNAVFDQQTGNVTESVRGVRFDMEQARRAWDETAEGETVTIPLIFDEPEVTTDQVTGQLFADVLAEKSTTLAGSTSARINNITLAAAAMNGYVIQPGEEFSYNDCLGERTAAKGYQSAGAFSGGQHVQSIGGGICQGSSTLYYCALKANLTITDRWCHQFVVSYLPLGMDATVSWGWPEFKFVNSREYPIKIESWVADGELTVRILGTDVDGTYVDITNETWEDPTHYYAQTYRNIYDANGNLISSQKEAYSSYDKEGVTTTTTTSTQTTTSQTQYVPPQQPVQQPAQQQPVQQQPTQQQPEQQPVQEQPPVQEQTPVQEPSQEGVVQIPVEGTIETPPAVDEQFTEPVTDPAAPEGEVYG